MTLTARTHHSLLRVALRRVYALAVLPLAAAVPAHGMFLAGHGPHAPVPAYVYIQGAVLSLLLCLVLAVGILRALLGMAEALRDVLDAHPNPGDIVFAMSTVISLKRIRMLLLLPIFPFCFAVISGLASFAPGALALWAVACLAFPVSLLLPFWTGLVRAGGFPLLPDRPWPLPSTPFALVARLAGALVERSCQAARH